MITLTNIFTLHKSLICDNKLLSLCEIIFCTANNTLHTLSTCSHSYSLGYICNFIATNSFTKLTFNLTISYFSHRTKMIQIPCSCSLSWTSGKSSPFLSPLCCAYQCACLAMHMRTQYFWKFPLCVMQSDISPN